MKITNETNGDVVLRYRIRDTENDDAAIDIQRRFSAQGTGYIRELVNGEWRQVCRKLNQTGSTLALGSNENLADVIRFEFKAWERADARSDYPEIIKAGRPRNLKGGKTVSMYLDDESLDRARSLGNGNVSEGIRAALANQTPIDTN